MPNKENMEEIRKTTISVRITNQEKEKILSKCELYGFGTISSFLRFAAFHVKIRTEQDEANLIPKKPTEQPLDGR